MSKSKILNNSVYDHDFTTLHKIRRRMAGDHRNSLSILAITRAGEIGCGVIAVGYRRSEGICRFIEEREREGGELQTKNIDQTKISAERFSVMTNDGDYLVMRWR